MMNSGTTCKRDMWTSHRMSHGTVGFDGQWDTHASVEEQVDIPWNVPWDCGMRWTIYGISGHLWREYTEHKLKIFGSFDEKKLLYCLSINQTHYLNR